MDHGAGRDTGAEPPELTVALLADLQAGLLDDATAARVRERARNDPAAAAILARLDAVRADLAELGADEESAPAVPAEVSARIGEAVRHASASAPIPVGHALARPTLTRSQRAAVVVGLLAAVAAVVVGAVMLVREPGPAFPTGPSASQITSPPGFPVPDIELRALLSTSPDLGPLGDAERLASCLAGLGYAPSQEVLGGRLLDTATGSQVIMLLPDEAPQRLAAVLVEPTCSAADTGLVARTGLDRP